MQTVIVKSVFDEDDDKDCPQVFQMNVSDEL